MWKILILQITEEICDLLNSQNQRLFPKKWMWNHGTSDLLYINQNILKEAKKRKENNKHCMKDKHYASTLNDRMSEDFKEYQWTIINKRYGKLEKWTSLEEDGS